ncbi:hypothetical protein R3W88_019420 [Solanum pinnatisectum]|uniref:Uncharacterized protein n=1 Tax=Solanum pinnatisectum TaxID=50273 RepID=A0AAV9KJ68_9SOLN|nr:hypothetical protein R3W88_019420 [Solanum pinnatisectum]
MHLLFTSNFETPKINNDVVDRLRTTLCLQYKPHYVAAGSMFLVAKLLKNQKQVIPSTSSKLTELKPIAGKATSSITESCISSVSVVAQDSRNMELVETRGASTSVTSKFSEKASCNSINSCGSADSAVEDGVCHPLKNERRKEICYTVSVSDHNGKFDIDRIKERLKRWKLEQSSMKKSAMYDEINSEGVMTRFLES